MPTADMERDKTFKIGGNYLKKGTWGGNWPYDTWNYYLNITIFPWLEVGYLCTLDAFSVGDYPWNKDGHHNYFNNQDRSFHFRLRLWKEGWWKDWTPQVVIGTNDPGSHDSYGGGTISAGGEQGNNNFLTRYWLAATKHFEFKEVGTLGVHAAFVIGNAMLSEHYKRPAVGLNFQFELFDKDNLAIKTLNGINLMVEYDARTVNIGAHYQLWKDHINLIAELNDGKHFSGGLVFKLHLK